MDNIVWYKHPGSNVEGYGIYIPDYNKLIIAKYTGLLYQYLDEYYGSKDKPLHRVYKGYYSYGGYISLLVGETSINVVIADSLYEELAGVVGVINDAAPLILDGYVTDEYMTNVTISGKWRAKQRAFTKPNGFFGSTFGVPIISTLVYNGNIITGYAIGFGNNSSYQGFYINNNYVGGDSSIDAVIDFGSFEQNIPKMVLDYFELNFDYIYPNTYTIKSPTGETLAQVVEQPPIKKTNLQHAGNAYQLSLTGTNDVAQTLSWSYETPEGMAFVGLSNRPNGPILIGLGESEVSIENSVDLYPVFRPYKIPSETFDINLFKNTAEYNRVDKTNYLTDVGTISGTMREASSITDLTITIERADLPNFNYVYIEKFGRYYFVNDIRILRNELFEIDMTVDVLMSYKDAIKSLRAFVDRNENTQNPMLIDKKKVIEQGVDIEDNYISNQVGFVSGVTESNADNAVCFVLTGYKISSENVEL